MTKRYFVTGIGTGVGKTLVSALLCQYLKADYFKPVQTGYPPDRDSEWIKQIVNYPITFHPEKYLLKTPASPHLAADDEHIQIDIQNIILPNTSNHLIIEGAGGLLVPLNQKHYIADLIRHLNAECVLVINNYLGCINHSLLSLYYLQKENIPFKGIVLNGSFDQRVKSAITKNLDHSKI
ncbi:MAG: dethiobiotin synthase, partial [Bacteroidia bacterium]|nr:dethiobiotin synthase [Bacteroidia bacterium]